MAKGWARVAFTEEFTSPAGERIDSENSELPAGLLASSLTAAQSEVEREWTNPREKLSLPEASFPSCGASRLPDRLARNFARSARVALAKTHRGGIKEGTRG
jgi:hypothetical protein